MTDFLAWWADHWPLVPVLVLLSLRLTVYRYANGWDFTFRLMFFELEYSVHRKVGDQ